MLNIDTVDRRVIARQDNVVRVDFGREPDPPAPRFPGATGLRSGGDNECIDGFGYHRPFAGPVNVAGRTRR